jgi:hypothetical protein
MVFPHESSHDTDRREVDRIAVLAAVDTEESPACHYQARRNFGPVEYRAIAIPSNPAEVQK